MSRRLQLWVAFFVVHLIVGALGWLEPNWPMGDVYAVYQPWSANALTGQSVMGIDQSFVYPQLALVPMILAQPIGFVLDSYYLGWGVLVVMLNAVAYWILVGNGRSNGRASAAVFWLVAMLALGPVGMYRLEGVTVPIAIVGLLLLARRPFVASTLLAIGTWIKVWPAALMAAAFVALRRRWSVVVAGLAVSAAVALVVVALGGAQYLFGFVSQQDGRGLQAEAPISTPFVWMSYFGVPGASIGYSYEMLTYQVTGPGVDLLANLMTPLLGVAALVIVVLGALKARQGASFARLFPPLALALVVSFIVFNKVGSPQFLAWLVAPVVLWVVLDRERAFPAAVTVVLLSLLTHLVYPIFYWEFLKGYTWITVVITVRNLGHFVLLGIAIAGLVRVPTCARASAQRAFASA